MPITRVSSQWKIKTLYPTKFQAVRHYIRKFQRFHEDHTRRINQLGEFTANGSPKGDVVVHAMYIELYFSAGRRQGEDN